MNKWFVMLALFYSGASIAALENYKIDNKHSFANFSIRHIVAKTSGTFTDITGVIKVDSDDLSQSSVNAMIKVASVQTGLAKRNDHLQGVKYLDSAHFGEITFVSDKVIAKTSTTGDMTGKLTIRGVTKTITMPFTVLGFGADPWGGIRAGFEAKTIIKASDFGFTWMKKAGSPVGDEIAITLLIEGIKAK
jgi:polyisoprenoid-binding protein YceI